MKCNEVMFKKRMEGHEIYKFIYTLEKGKLKKLKIRIYDVSSLYPTVMKNPL